MILAAIGDIDGNVWALEAVLADIDAAGIQTIVHVGDCVGFGSEPNETVALLRARVVPGVQGDMDRRAARFARKQQTMRAECTPEVFDALQRTYDALRSEHVEYLAGLPRERRLTVDGVAIYLCHGSPNGQDVGLGEDDDLRRFQRFREVAQADVIVMGHTRAPFSRNVDSTLFVNPGAVADSPACYAVVDTEEEPWTVTFRRVNCGSDGFA
jgi:putative phosphoesterase